MTARELVQRRLLVLGLTLATIGGSSAATTSPLQAQQPVRPVQGGVLLNFQDADFAYFVSMLAQAAGINYVATDLPQKSVTIRTTSPMSSAEAVALLHSVARAHGVGVTEENGLLRLEGSISPLQGMADDPRQLYIHRLRHARAPVLANTLQALFSGVTSTGRTTTQNRALSQQLQQLQQRTAQVPQQVMIQAAAGNAASIFPPFIVPDEATNSLLVRAAPGDWQIILQAVQSLDLKPLQVLIEVVIAEVQRSSDLHLGVEVSAENESGTRTGELVPQNLPETFTLSLRSSGSIDIEATLAALAGSGNVRIVSRPILQAQNNQEATILSGELRPFVQVQSTVTTGQPVSQQVVQYQDVGTELTILPTINPEGYVNLAITQTVSNATTETQFDAPIISTREATTQLLARDGQTVAIGGLIDRAREVDRSGIPLLKDIPLIGWLFGSDRRREVNSELFLFLTPHIVESDEDADRIRRELEENAELIEPLTPIRPLVTPRAQPDSVRPDSIPPVRR